MSYISGVSEQDRVPFVPFGSSPSSVASFPITHDVTATQSVMSSATTNTILPPEQANINFKPTTTAVTKISKLKLHVLLDSTVYTAGGLLTGRLALTSASARSLKLGEISVELTAYEELSVKEYTASQSFLSSRLVFQCENLPPSNAVYGPKENGYWTAKKGKTTFPFAFKIPIDAPSSVGYGASAYLKYVVTGVVQFMNNNKQETLIKSKEAFVVEAWDGQNPIYKQPVDGINMKQLWMGGSGAVTLEGTLSETLFQSGGNVSVQVRVKNETKRRVQGMKIAITQKLIVLANKNKKEIDDVKVIGDTVAEEWFKNKDFLFDCGEDRSTTVHVNVPKNVRTIRNTALFEVVCYVVISLYLGPFTKDLTVHLPVYIAHSASLQPVPIADADSNVFPNHYNMMDENTEFFVEDTRKDDDEVLGLTSNPVNIPKKGVRVLPWSNAEDDGRGHFTPTKGSAGSSIFGSASPKKIGSFASSLLGRPKQMSPPNPAKLIAKSPPLAPASPYAYIPAIERVRYLSFTTQEQGAIQKRPFDVTSRLGGFGKYDGSQSQQVSPPVSPPASEYEFVNVPSKNVQKWLDKQQPDDIQSEGSSPALSDSADNGEPIATPGGKSPWSHINNTQEIVNTSTPSKQNGQETAPVDIPVQNSDFSSDSFKRINNLTPSPSGPSGLTLLMRKKSPMPKIEDNMFEETMSITSTSNTYDAYENVPKGRPLPTPTPKPIEVNNEKKSDLLGLEQEGPNNVANRGGNLSSLLKWGTSWIGYGYGGSNNQFQNSSISDLNEKTQLQSIEENIFNDIPNNRPRRQLPPPPTTAIKNNNIATNNTLAQEETQVPKTRPRRSLPAVPTSVPQSPITPNSPIIEESETTINNNVSNSPPRNNFANNNVSNSPPRNNFANNNVSSSPPRNNFVKPLNIQQVSPMITEQQQPSKVTSPEKSDKHPPSPPKRSYLAGIPITKASIFAALGQKPLGIFSQPSPAPAPVVAPKKTTPVALSTSPPKQFNIQRKPLELNSLIKEDLKVIERIKNEFNELENLNELKESENEAENNPPTSPKLAIPPVVPKKSSKPVQVTSPVLIINNKSNESKDDTSMPQNSPIDPTKVLASPTAFLNTTIAKPIVALNEKDNLEERLSNKIENNSPTSPKLAIPPVVPKKSSKPVQVTSPVPIVNNKSNENDDDSSMPHNSPIDSTKVLASPTTYLNTTIAKPIVALNEKDNLEERLLINNINNNINNRKKKKDNDNDNEEEGRLTAKITEPPKPILSPRIQEYINKYNKATADKN